jgi:hypothetical protein
MCIQLAQDRIRWSDLVNTGNESSGFVKGRAFLDSLSDYQFLKEDPAL